MNISSFSLFSFLILDYRKTNTQDKTGQVHWQLAMCLAVSASWAITVFIREALKDLGLECYSFEGRIDRERATNRMNE